MSEDSERTLQGWVSIILRHFTTFVVILGFFWIVAKPHAEEFVRSAVNDRINLLEYKIDYLLREVSNMNKKLERMQKSI